jgi:Rieske Fe-S protein
VLVGAGALGATCLLAACGTDNSSGAGSPEPPAGSAAAPTGGATGGTGDSNESGAAALALAADVPTGGGIIKGDYVITQPAKGTFKAFSKVCTHQGCPVTEIDGGTINCKCHNSSFSIEDGSVQGGPAKKPLTETKVKVDGDNIVAA